MTKLSKKSIEQDEFIETVFDFGEWIEAHWRKVAVGIGIVVALILIGVGWNAARGRAASEANRLFAEGLKAFSPPADGEGTTAPPRYAEALPLFEQAEAKGGSQPIGAIARLFHGRTLLALERPADAIPVLEGAARASSPRIAAQAKVSLAEAVEAGGDPERAATLLQDVASATDGAYPQDAALFVLATVRERQGKAAEAKKVYEDLLARFPQSAFAADARQGAAR